MKKFTKSVFFAVLLSVFAAVSVFGYNYYTYMHVQSISSARILVDTEALSAGGVITDSAMSYVSVPENEFYDLMDAVWIDDVESLSVGDEPRMTVYLNAIPRQIDYSTYSKIWLFEGAYNSSNVRVSKGTYVNSAIRDSGYTLEVTLRVNTIKGAYNAPENVFWSSQSGVCTWIPAEYGGSGLYDVVCYRNGTAVKRLQNYTGTSYNFYPYMTREGDYTVKVRCAVPAAMSGKGAKVSEYAESDGLYITSDRVSDGTGQTHADENGSSGQGNNGNYPNGTGTENVAGWVTDSTGTYFRYPNGQLAPAGWLHLNGVWYFLDTQGRQLTGWQTDSRTGLRYYMDPSSGIMKTGWFFTDGYWYYLEKAVENTEGHMVTGWRDINGYTYYFNQNGIMVTGWFEIGGKWYYFYPMGSTADGNYGYMAVNTRIGDFTIGPDGTWQN